MRGTARLSCFVASLLSVALGGTSAPVDAATVAVPTTKAAVAAAPTVAASSKATITTKTAATVRRSPITTKRTTKKSTTKATVRKSVTTKRKAVSPVNTAVGGPIVAPADGLPGATVLNVVTGSAVTIAPVAVAPLPATSTTLGATVSPLVTTSTSTSTSTSTTAAPGAGFDIVVPNPGIAVTAGATAVFLVIVAPRSTISTMVTFVVQGLPDGTTATMSPNPTAGASELRIVTPSNMIPATYNLRLVGTSGSVTRTTSIAMAVAAPTSTTTSSTSTTVPPVGTGAFALSVVGDGQKLRTGGAVSFDVTIVPGQSFPGPVNLLISGVPALVSAAFTTTPTVSKSTLWLSTTLSPVPGTYSLLLIATSGTAVQTVPLVLTIE